MDGRLNGNKLQVTTGTHSSAQGGESPNTDDTITEIWI